jgi:hypothetical protein
MKYAWYGLFILCICSLMGSATADVIGTQDKAVQAIAEPMLDTILEGFATNDYAKYSKDFDPTLKETISDKRFLDVDRQIESSIGNFSSRQYLGFLTKGKMTVVLWKAKFDKSNDDVLIKLVVSKRGDKYLVTGLWFQ